MTGVIYARYSSERATEYCALDSGEYVKKVYEENEITEEQFRKEAYAVQKKVLQWHNEKRSGNRKHKIPKREVNQ